MAHPKVNFHPVAFKRKAKTYIDLLEHRFISENWCLKRSKRMVYFFTVKQGRSFVGTISFYSKGYTN